jgi:hypothetical protein
MIDFNGAEKQQEYSLIPANTIAKARLTINPGYDESDRFLTASKHTDSRYLNCEYVIMEGPYERRKIFDKIGVSGSETFENMGRSRIRAILESARGIDENDQSEEAVNARKISSYDELDGLEVTIKIGVQKDKSGNYDDKNIVKKILPNSGPIPTKSEEMIDDNIPF